MAGFLSGLCMLLFLLSGCSGSSDNGGPVIAGVTPVTLSFSLPVAQLDIYPLPPGKQIDLAGQHAPAILLNRGYDAFATLLVPEAVAAPVPVGIASIIVEITGPGMTMIRDVIAVTTGLLQVTRSYMVPSGANRTVNVFAVDAANAVRYQGSTLVAQLQAAIPVNIPMTLLPSPGTDIVPPVVTPPAAITVAALSAVGTPATAPGIAAFLTGAIATDNVGVIALTHDGPVIFPRGLTTVTFTAIDAAGNIGTATSTVTVTDQAPPVITLLGANPVTVAQGSVYTDAGATATDNVDGNITANIVTVNTVNTAVVGTYTVTYNVSDAAGNAATQLTRTVNVTDQTLPVVTAPAPIVVAAVDALGTPASNAAIVTFLAGATATDNVGVVGAVTNNAPVTFPLGATIVTFTATDAAGNIGTATSTVTITDQAVPVITLLGTTPLTVALGSVYTDAGATALDNVDGVITANIVTVNPVNTAVVGTYTVTYDVSDAAGNAAAQVTRTVNVAPAAELVPPVITLRGSTPVQVFQGSVYNDAGATAIDDVDGNITANIVNVNSVNTAIVGAYRVTYDVSDAAFNAATQVTRLVNVVTAPATVAGVDWSWVNPKPMADTFEAIAYNGTTTYVAVGEASNIFTSADGITWTEQNSGTSAIHLYDVVWSGTQFVAVGGAQGGGLPTILTSPDGVTWTPQVSGAPEVPIAVTWAPAGVAPGQFVAVGGTQYPATSNRIQTSPDGITWTPRFSPVTGLNLNDVVWNGTLFVAVGNGGTIETSPDGITWTAQVSGVPGNNLWGVAWSGTQFVAVSDSGAVLTSPNGTAWTLQASGAGLKSIAWSGTQFVGAGVAGAIVTSPDGIT